MSPVKNNPMDSTSSIHNKSQASGISGGKSMHKGTLRSYTIGFVLSLLFTIAPYLLVTEKFTTGTLLLFLLAMFAVAQVLVQLLFFLHINQEGRPRWHSLAFGFMTIVVVIVVFGSLWIMNNLHYNMMPGNEVEKYIQSKEAIDSYEKQR